MSEDNKSAGSFLKVEDLCVWKQRRVLLSQINFSLDSGNLLAIIGPLGAGKTTLLRCLNRLAEIDSELKIEGSVQLMQKSVYDASVDVQVLRRNVGMIFSKPAIFPSMNLFENVAAGLRISGVQSGAQVGEAVEKALRQVFLWDDFKGKLHQSASEISMGDAQKLCVARALVLKPKVLLMDEPTSSLSLQEVTHFEQVLQELRKKVTIIFTTNHRKQAARVSDKTAFLLDGELIEIGKTSDIFMNPQDVRTEDYLTGRFG